MSAQIMDRVQPVGQIELVLLGPDGKIKEIRKANAVTAQGRNGIADNLLESPTLGKPTHIALGTGSPAANALGNELNRRAMDGKTRSNNVVTMTAFWDAGEGSGAITEAGVFNQAAGGNMWLSANFAVVNKGSQDTLQVNWTLQITGA